MTHSCVWHGSFLCLTWLIHVCDMTHSYVWHDSFCVWHDSLICLTWLIHVCDMTHSYVWTHSCVWHDSFICVTWLIHLCDITHPFVWHDSLTRVTDSFICDMTPSTSTLMWHDTFTSMTWLLKMYDMTPSHVQHCSFVCRNWESAGTGICRNWELAETGNLQKLGICRNWESDPVSESSLSLTADWIFCIHYMTHHCVRHDLWICETWLMHVWHDSFCNAATRCNTLQHAATLRRLLLIVLSDCLNTTRLHTRVDINKSSHIWTGHDT